MSEFLLQFLGNGARKLVGGAVLKFFLSYETKVYQSSRKKPNSRR
jgi:hypothetical protein